MTPSVLVVGAGSIGRRHLANLRALGVARLAVCEPDEDRRAAAASAMANVETYAALSPALETFRPTAALICTPPTEHVAPARELVRAGVDLFLEKPVAASMDGVRELIREAADAARVVQVGYNLRFHPVLVAVKRLLAENTIGSVLYAHAQVGQYLPDWRPTVDYRDSYTARRELGGGILLDASHEIDYLTWLLGRPGSVACAAGKASSLEVDVEESATLLLGYASGMHAVVHMDFVRRGYLRTLDLVGETGNIIGDIGAKTVVLQRGTGAAEAIVLPVNDMYRAELEAFLDCVAYRRQPLVDLAQAVHTLEIVLLAKASAADGARRSLA